jgi:uncharacterized membrane protein YphA (DoxX/SURF4 family)
MTKNRVLWIAQALLALVFLMAGGAKLAMPADALAKAAPMLSVGFLRFVSVCEVLGGLGLVLPWLLKIQPRLTPLAAAALVVIMMGAIVVTVMTMGAPMAAFPAIVGVLLAWVAYSRFRMTPA